ncbi:MAG: hypothetical protein ACYSRR_03720 [Planctomycetota bacterium]|jgi:hypothetical protein
MSKTGFLTLCFSILVIPAVSAGAIPTAEELESLSRAVKPITENFFKQSRPYRFAFELEGRFYRQADKEDLNQLAKAASENIRRIEEKQITLKKQIEDYQGDDWESRFGETGFWRKLCSDIYATGLAGCQIDYFVALSSGQSEKEHLCRDIFTRLESLGEIHKSGSMDFLTAKMSVISSQYPKEAAEKLFEKVSNRDDVSDAIALRARLEKIKLRGCAESNELERLVENIEQGSCNDDFELILSLAFLQRRYAPQQLERTFRQWPQTRYYMSEFVLAYVTEQPLTDVSIIDGQLAAFGVLADKKERIKDCSKLFDGLCNREEFQTPLILYAAASGLSESLPVRAVELFLQASEKQQTQNCPLLSFPASYIAQKAVRLAYNCYADGLIDCQPALKAFDYYSQTANEKIDDTIEYLYAKVLKDCGEEKRAYQLLKKIAAKPHSKWAKTARLELILRRLEKKDRTSAVFAGQLYDFMDDCNGVEDNELKSRAAELYCRELLNQPGVRSAQKVLDAIDGFSVEKKANINAFIAQALQRLGSFDRSARCLLAAIDANSCDYATQAMDLLGQVIELIDELQENNPAFEQTVKDYKRLAELCRRCQADSRAELFLAEMSLFQGGQRLTEISENIKKLRAEAADDDVDFLRVKARLAHRQGRFSRAAALWSTIAKLRKQDAARQSYDWWRARFYVLSCMARAGEADKSDIFHAVEILENSYLDIPSFWAAKLIQLKDASRLGHSQMR